ncbi:MAG: ABC transporter substrate-binding protein [Eubacteriales bacterium]|nr:ABC transporter substrate-binding protein [Eubacteriales bacterium]
MKRLLAFGLALLLLLGVVAGCAGNEGTKPSTESQSTSGGEPSDSSPGGENSAKFGDTLTVVSSTKGNNFDPLTNYESDWIVCGQIYDTLFKLDADGNPGSHVAESWQESEDGMTITIKLREDIVFHDGTALNAEAVVFSLDVSHGVPANAWLDDLVAEWKAVDEYTLEIKKGHPYTPVYYSLLARPQIVSPTAYQADPEAFAQNPVGSGPYKFVSFGNDDVVTLEANENYFLGEPYFKNLVIRPVMESATSVIALQNGEVDVVLSLAPNQVPLAKELDGIVVEESTGWSQTMMIMSGEVLSGNRYLRQAIAHAVNPEKAAILNEQPNAKIATDLFSEKMMGPYSGLVEPLDYDVSKVPELLEKANYTSDIVVPIRVTQQHAALAQSVQADLQAVGISAEIQQLDEATHSNTFSDGSFSLSFWEYGNDQSSTEDLLTYFKSDNFYGAYMEVTSEYDDYVSQFGDFATEEERMDVMKNALELQVEFANMSPLYESVFNIAYREGLSGFNPWSVATYHYYFGDTEVAE